MCQYDQIYEYKARRSSIWSLPNMPSFNYQTNWGFSFSIQHICLPTYNFSKTLSNTYNSVFFICQQRRLLRVRKLSIKWYFHSDSTHLFSHSTFLPKTKWMYFSIVLSQYTVHQGQEFRYIWNSNIGALCIWWQIAWQIYWSPNLVIDSSPNIVNRQI